MVPSYAGSEAYTHRLGGFEIERTPTTAPNRLPEREYDDDEDDDALDLPSAVGNLLAAKSRPFSVSGRIPVDPSTLTLFFRSQSNATHSLDFPIDAEYDSPPALDVLIATCQPYQDGPSTSSMYPYTSPQMPRPSTDSTILAYPSMLPFSTTLELANRPILDAVKSALLPSLPGGNYLVAQRERLEILVAGAHRRGMPPPNDGRAATLIVSLPVRYKGGALVVSSPTTSGLAPARRERYGHPTSAIAAMEWVAYAAECEAEVEPVRKGVRVDLYYTVHVRTYGPSSLQPDPLLAPSDDFRTLVGNVLNLTRGRKIGFYLSGQYGVNPAEAIADSLLPLLSGGDSLLYHALKTFQLTPELRWAAGGFIWPADRIVDISGSDPSSPISPSRRGLPGNPLPPPPGTMPLVRGTFGATGGYGGYGGSHPGGYGGSQVGGYGGSQTGAGVHGSSPYPSAGYSGSAPSEADALSARVTESGATPLAQADITVLADWDNANGGALVGAGKERVPFLSGGELGRLVVNVMLVVYVA